MKQNVYIEFYGEQIDQAEVVAEAKKIWTDSGKKLSDLTKLEIYIKPEDDIKALRHEVEYLRQEVEYLKKISAIKNTKR